MRGVLIVAGLLLVAAAPPRIVAISLPAATAMFAELGPGQPSADAINNNCLACHSTEMVLNQPHLTPAEWAGEVTKMRQVYKAPVSDADAAAITAWLVAHDARRRPETPPKSPAKSPG
ncbi:MAG: sulfite:cytochrome C oxidoreductase subunit b precursor [Alphaproteobacteria bacterium PA4]|nr:MAG: sulfite:cytochrome C oxidoreductase subunit b precursor [Alphaproteobacteria bacterium PA4]